MVVSTLWCSRILQISKHFWEIKYFIYTCYYLQDCRQNEDTEKKLQIYKVWAKKLHHTINNGGTFAEKNWHFCPAKLLYCKSTNMETKFKLSVYIIKLIKNCEEKTKQCLIPFLFVLVLVFAIMMMIYIIPMLRGKNT